MDARALSDELWRGAARNVEIRLGDATDPLAGLVRWRTDPPHDLLVGRGFAMSTAIDSAVFEATLGAPVASGRHLERSIRTGYLCAYEPDSGDPATWKF